ncbi:hypothetical protein HDF14_003911 [Edaphobacter lichenicola]|uniref:Uncharacterized protein n=1 Tax=Tunturiibacter gelidiferens TaxID=3069689 RepID=A0A9X0U5C4_9BACT|nr:hypothetical protein [Edaphobacter lichenicola]
MEDGKAIQLYIVTSPPGTVKGRLSTRPKNASFVVRAIFGTFDLPMQVGTNYDPATGIVVISRRPHYKFCNLIVVFFSEQPYRDTIAEFRVDSYQPGLRYLRCIFDPKRHHDMIGKAQTLLRIAG